MDADRIPLALLLTAVLGATPALAGGPLTSALTESGALSGPSFTESWTYAGNNGDRVVVSAVTTGGVVNTVITVRAPGGALISSSAADRSELQLTSNGTYTIEVSDLGLNDVGTYNLTLMNVTAGPLTHAGDLDGGPIASGEVVSVTMGTITDMDAFTFSGTSGQRVVFGVFEGTAVPFNVGLILYPPNGGPAESNTSSNRLDVQLASTGTYTVIVEDSGNDHTGSYTASFLNVTAGPHSIVSDPDGGAIVSANLVTGTMNGAVDLDAFTFSGTSGDRIVVSSVTTSGTMNTFAYLYPPNGGAPQQAGAPDRWDFQLTQTGTHTLVIEDASFGETGTYSTGLMNLTSGPLTHAGDLDGGPIASGEVKSASIGAIPDFDAYTFSGTAGQRIVFGVLEGTAVPFNVALTLYPPNGGASVANTGGSNRIDHQLAASGTYTVVVEDLGTDHTGTYDATYLNVTAGPHSTGSDPDGGGIASANLVTGTINAVLDLDAFTFSGSAGDRVVVAAVTTSGTMNTFTYLYPPDGGAPQVAQAIDRWDFQLTQTGTHTLVMEDASFGETGTYTMGLLNLTSGPLTHAGDLDGGPIASGEVKSATMGTLTDLDAYTFSGTMGQRVVFGVLEGTAVPFNVALRLYPPNGGPVEANTGGSNRLDVQLAATGTYAVMVEDLSNDHTGSYEATYLNVTGGPHSTVADPDGGALPSATLGSGTMNGVLDLDAFTFNGSVGDRIIVATVTTSGAMNTFTYLYPPNGGVAQIAHANDRWDFQLTQSGTHTLVFEDASFGETGTYATTLLNVTAGPLTHAGDLDGGPMAGNVVTAGTAGTVPDLDGYTFSGTLGDRVVIGGIATGGALFNTLLSLYPPAGGSLLMGSSGGDRLDVQLPSTGTYTLVVEDVGNDLTGSYSLSLANVTAGPVVSAADPEGGWLSLGDVRMGNVSPGPDMDVYWFNAQAGDNAVVSCVTTSGPLNTMSFLYPPGGGAAVVSTAVDNWNYGVLVTGRHALLVQHLDLTQTGGYQLGLSGTLTPITLEAPALALPSRLALSPARPNPSSAEAVFTVALPRRAAIQLRIYDLRGALVRTLTERTVEAGTHHVAWDGRDDRGRRVGAGVFLARLGAGDESVTRRVVRLD